ncbi:MAG TPA: energy transducer TonB [Gemmatimonadaceae bacterium]|nr:energy transducer TonB [Gemmatimonadaceae bacterium]
MTRICALFGFLALASSDARAQACVAPGHPYFEFQVDKPATFRGDTTVLPRPRDPVRGEREDSGFHLVSFVVDTAGVPDVQSFKALKSPSLEVSRATRDAVAAWRYRPAEVKGCRVPQLVQTPVLFKQLYEELTSGRIRGRACKSRLRLICESS